MCIRDRKCTETAISKTVNEIEKHLSNKDRCIGLFLDIQAAFDTISPEFIKERLYHHGGDKDLVEWYYNYLTHRNITTEIGGYEAKNTIRVGFPQGGVCSAKFWIIAFDPAIEIINQWGCKGQGFADDLCITMGG